VRTALRVTGLAVAVALVVGLAPDAAVAAPGNGQIDAAAREAERVEAQIRDLSDDLVRAQDVVDDARHASVIALDEYQAMQGAYQVAQADADRAAAAAAQATEDLGIARDDVAAFARRSYMEGSTYAGAAALITAGDPAQLIERAALLEAAGSHRSDVLDRVTVLQEQAADADAAAKQAVATAADLKQVAEEKLAVAQAAEVEARAQAAVLVTQQAELQTQLAAAQEELAELVGEKEAEERTAQVDRPAPSRPAPPVGNQDQAGPGDGNAAAVAIAAAKDHLGLPYAWGGGGTFGPGPGLHPDQGVVGFDCSGLTQYAYAQAGISIPRNSRAQYAALPKVASNALQPGDLVFWANDPSDPETIYHVAIWLGGNQVIQAPQSGDVVKISTMWWGGYAGAVRPSA
jgi:cell wall-associated NlpC family hydrolase